MVAPLAVAAVSTAGRSATLQAEKLAAKRAATSEVASLGNKAIAQKAANSLALPSNLGDLSAGQALNTGADRPSAELGSRVAPRYAKTNDQAAQRQFSAQLQQQLLEKRQSEQEEQKGLKEQIEDKASLVVQQLWSGGSLLSVAELEGAALWSVTGGGLLIDGVSMYKTIAPPNPNGKLAKFGPPAFSLTNPMSMGQATKAGVMSLLLIAILPIFMLFIGIIGAVILSVSSLSNFTGLAPSLFGTFGTELITLFGL